MQVGLTERFITDFASLSGPLSTKTREIIAGLRRIDAKTLRESANPGWRLHALRGSKLVSLSIDMNFRILSELSGDRLLLHRAVKHDSADRPAVNRNDRAQEFVTISTLESSQELYHQLLAFGIPIGEATAFKNCTSENDVLEAATQVTPAVGDLALRLYETAGFSIPQARFRMLQQDEDLEVALRCGGREWELYLHPAQEFIVALPDSAQVAICGSAGTGKSICAVHRARALMDGGHTVGFVCPNATSLAVVRNQLEACGRRSAEGYFLVPGNQDELIQLRTAVEHLVIDEAQEVPTAWLTNCLRRSGAGHGLTMFYDLNQMGGHIPKNDRRRFDDRLAEWNVMLRSTPRLQRLVLGINYRNSKEIAEKYTALLKTALPTKVLSEAPVFETGSVVEYQIKETEILDTLCLALKQLLSTYAARDLAVAILGVPHKRLVDDLLGRGFQVTRDVRDAATFVGRALDLRGHERQAMVVLAPPTHRLTRNFGHAIEAYIAMSRAIRQLIIFTAEVGQ